MNLNHFNKLSETIYLYIGLINDDKLSNRERIDAVVELFLLYPEILRHVVHLDDCPNPNEQYTDFWVKKQRLIEIIPYTSSYQMCLTIIQNHDTKQLKEYLDYVIKNVPLNTNEMLVVLFAQCQYAIFSLLDSFTTHRKRTYEDIKKMVLNKLSNHTFSTLYVTNTFTNPFK